MQRVFKCNRLLIDILDLIFELSSFTLGGFESTLKLFKFYLDCRDRRMKDASFLAFLSYDIEFYIYSHKISFDVDCFDVNLYISLISGVFYFSI